MDGLNIGPVVGVAFGCAWGVAGATALPRPWQAWAIGSSIGISAALIVAFALPQKQRHSGTFRGHIYGIAVAFEVAAIFGTVWLLRQFALSQFLLPVIGFIVGLHFLGLWKATDLQVFLWTAAVRRARFGDDVVLPIVERLVAIENLLTNLRAQAPAFKHGVSEWWSNSSVARPRDGRARCEACGDAVQ